MHAAAERRATRKEIVWVGVCDLVTLVVLHQYGLKGALRERSADQAAETVLIECLWLSSTAYGVARSPIL